MKKMCLILTILFLIPLVNAQITIDSFISNPEKVLPGGQLRLTIIVKNVGEAKIENILIKLDLSQVPFAPLSSSNENVIDEIKRNDEKNVFFNLVALPDAEPKIYKIPVEIAHNSTVKESLISLEVNAQTNLDLILDNSEILKLNQQGKINLKFVNNGLAQVKFLKVSLEESPSYQVLSPSSIYIGEVDTDDFETEEFTIIPRVKNPQLNFNIEYRDVNNNWFKEKKIVNINVYTDEEAKSLGFENQNPGWLIFAVLVVLVAILIYAYRRMKRKHVN